MSAGQKTKGVVLLAVVLTAVVAAAIAAPAVSAAKPKLVFTKARVFSDGFVTPGQLETIAVAKLPPRAPLRVLIEPPPTTPECGELYFCDPAPTSPAPGYPPYRSSGKGRALLTFVMPSSYFVATDPFRPQQGHMQNFANGQAVHIDVEGVKRTKKAKRIGFGFARAVVQLQTS